jgi:hypothetical protein
MTLEGAMLVTGLHKVYVVVLGDFLSRYRLQALRTKALCLPDLLAHVIHQEYTDRRGLLLFYFSETRSATITFSRRSWCYSVRIKKNSKGRNRGLK